MRRTSAGFSVITADMRSSTLGLQIAGETYTPFGHRDYAKAIQDIKKSDADVIFNTINGDSNIAFYDELAAQGITSDKIPVVATSIGEDELRSLLPARVKGHLATWNYFQSIDSPRNKEFVARFQDEFGWDRVTSDPMEAAPRPDSPRGPRSALARDSHEQGAAGVREKHAVAGESFRASRLRLRKCNLT